MFHDCSLTSPHLALCNLSNSQQPQGPVKGRDLPYISDPDYGESLFNYFCSDSLHWGYQATHATVEEAQEDSLLMIIVLSINSPSTVTAK